MNTEKRVVLITGGNSGIGKEAAKKFAENHDIVYILGRNQEKLVSTCRELNDITNDIDYIVADVSHTEECKKAIESVVSKENRLDVLVNCAGVSYSGPTVDMTEDIWDKTININLKGTFFMCKYAIPALAQTQGSIINISSDAGLVGNKELSIYCASKGGVSLLTKSLALELAPQKIRVNAVCPAEVETPMLLTDIEQSAYTSREEFDAEYLKIFPQGKHARYIRPEEVAECIYFLADTKRVEAITGTCLSIDFGVTSGY